VAPTLGADSMSEPRCLAFGKPVSREKLALLDTLTLERHL
jgi:hypothetical protein